MGRGPRNQQASGAAASIGPRSRSGNLQRVAFGELGQVEPGTAGEIITLADGSELELDGEISAELARGMAGIEKVLTAGEGRYTVEFADGTTALVDVNRGAVAFPPGTEFDQSQLQGAYLAALGRHSAFADPVDSSDAMLAFADAVERANDGQPGSMEAMLKAGQALLAEQNGDLMVNSPDLQQSLANNTGQENDLTPRQLAKRRLERARERVNTARELGGDVGAARQLLYDVNMADGEVGGPDPKEIEERQAAAAALGAEIPEVKIDFDENGKSIGEYHIDDDLQEKFEVVRNRLAFGQRAFAFRGPPGSGKGEFAKQIAAIREQPCVEFNVGPDFSWEDAIAGDGLDAEVVNGQPVTKTVGKLGTIAEAVQHPCILVINEAEGMQNEAVRLHSMLGDNIADPGSRYLTLNSVNGERQVKVHEDCIVVLTYNSGEEDNRFKTAVHDRVCNLDFEYPSEKDEAERIATIVSRGMQHDDEIPEELRRDYGPEEVLPIVKLTRQLRDAHRSDPEAFVEVPGARQCAHLFADIVQAGYNGGEDPVGTMQQSLGYLLPGSENMAPDERQRYLREQMGDVYQELTALAQDAWDRRKDKDVA